jgi:hypothetical protein
MNTDDRLDSIDKKVTALCISNARLEEQIKALVQRVEPMQGEILERCKNEVRAWGWKSITAISTAVISGGAGIAMSLFR